MTDDIYLDEDDAEDNRPPVFRACSTCGYLCPQQYLYVEPDGRILCMDCDPAEAV